MAQEFESITTAFAAYECSMREERFYDAHADLEHLWYPRRFEDDDEVKLWKGFINAAVCFELIKRGRPNSAEVAWQTYLKYSPLLENLVTPHKQLYVRIRELIETTKGHYV